MEKEDGMFTKKTLGPMACASCEDKLVNVAGVHADYNNWKKMPGNKDVSNERIARYGQGFSKILSTLRDDISQMHLHSNMPPHVHDRMTLH